MPYFIQLMLLKANFTLKKTILCTIEMYDQSHDVQQQVSLEPLWGIELGTGALKAVFSRKYRPLLATPKTKIPEISSVENRQDGRHFTHYDLFVTRNLNVKC